MRIKFLGAAGTVTGSSYVLTSSGGQSILIDLGMFQGPSEIEEMNYLPFAYDGNKLSGAVLTHAHLDHCGRLPIILSLGFKGNFWMTPGTRDLTELSLLDSAKIAKEDKKKVLYDQSLATQTISRFKTVDYRTPFSIGDFKITFRDAGHILGSCSLEIEEKNSNSLYRKIVFSGDLGNTPEDLLRETELIDSADVVIIESTYGDRLHPKDDPSIALQSEINSVEKSGGALLIPAFSLDRTQEVLHLIMHLKSSGKILLETPIFLDSPMAQKATVDYLKYKKIFNSHIQSDLEFGSPFEFPGLEVIYNWKESQSIRQVTGAKVIIAGSGMMMGGRILGHAEYYLPIESTRLFIVGYQGEDTLGRELLEGKKEVKIGGSSVLVRGTISSTEAMSSHADQSQLINWLGHIKGVRKVFVTHSDDGPRKTLSEKISSELGISDITLPVLGQEFSF
jgi:metallo-beta-lactamase family protein